MAEPTATTADGIVNRATVFLNHLNAHPNDHIQNGEYLMEFVQTDRTNLRIMITHHLLCVHQGLLHFKINPNKIWHILSFSNHGLHVELNDNDLNITKASGWSIPTNTELKLCFYAVLTNLIGSYFKDKSHVQPDQLRFLIHLSGLRFSKDLIEAFQALRSEIPSLKDEVPNEIKYACEDFLSVRKIFEKDGGTEWEEFIRLVRIEDINRGVPCLFTKEEYRDSVTSPDLDLKLGRDKVFQQMSNNHVITVVNGANDWRSVTVNDFASYISSIIYYLK